MPNRNKKTEKNKPKSKIREQNLQSGYALVHAHPLFDPIMDHVCLSAFEHESLSHDGWLVMRSSGVFHANRKRLAEPEEWAYVIAHAVLHLVFDHFKVQEHPIEWATACDVYVTRFLQSLKIGRRPAPFNTRIELPNANEQALYELFCHDGVPQEFRHFSTAGPHHCDCVGHEPAKSWNGKLVDWQAMFADGLEAAVRSAINVSGGLASEIGAQEYKITPAKRARSWLISSFPLLASLASAFDLIESRELCNRMNISIAAVQAESREIYINPAGVGRDEQEHRFVIAHEFLHVALRHHLRRQGRDAYLWNIACDYVINGWLIEMGVGIMPSAGGLYDPELKGLSAEAIYDRIVRDLRRFRKLATLRGNCQCGDILDGDPQWWGTTDGLSLDDFYRRCLAQGLELHQSRGRGYLPASLVEEIRALSQPPIPWDVELAQWFDRYFPPLEKHRSYARPSRRQASTPDIPRPSHCPATPDSARTFAVILDTSGSMDRELLGKALGAIASYSIARDVPFARVVFCDAVAYDAGYMAPESISGKVRVKGRGGTVLQPGVDLIEGAADFPRKGPMLIITDGQCDRLAVRRDHAFLMPDGAVLPFNAHGPIFRLK